MNSKHYDVSLLMSIAEECREFEHIINAMGFGYSLLNVNPDKFVQQCSDCVNWSDGNCNIFLNEIAEPK